MPAALDFAPADAVSYSDRAAASGRGPQGGHGLARNVGAITLEEVAGALGSDPPLERIDGAAGCALSGCCAPRDVRRAVEDAIRRALTTAAIADLAGARRKPADAASVR